MMHLFFPDGCRHRRHSPQGLAVQYLQEAFEQTTRLLNIQFFIQ